MLEDLFGKYSDKVSETYNEFMDAYLNQGLTWAWMMRKEFFSYDKTKDLPFVFCLPLLTHSRIQLARSEEEINQELKELKKKYQSIPELQGRQIPEVPTIRDLLDQYFLIYQDDEIEWTIKFSYKTLIHKKGLIKDLVVNMNELLNSKVYIQAGDMVNVNIKLIKKGNQRTSEEKKAFIDESDAFVENVLIPKFKSINLENRKELFNKPLDKVALDDLETREVVALEDMIYALSQNEWENEKVISQRKSLRLLSLDKMQDWIVRPNAGGYDEEI